MGDGIVIERIVHLKSRGVVGSARLLVPKDKSGDHMDPGGVDNYGSMVINTFSSSHLS